MEISKKLVLVSGITAVDTANRTIMLGVGVVAYDKNPEHYESLINPNILFCNIDKHPKKISERQYLIFNYREIPSI